MNSIRRHRVLVVALLLGAVIGGFRWTISRSVRNASATGNFSAITADTSSPQSPDVPLASVPVAPIENTPSITQTASTPTAAPVSAEIRAILPSVASTVGNWREYRPDSYTVRAAPHGPEVTFRVAEIKNGVAFTTWIGRSDIPGESFVAVATQDGLDAILTTYEGQPVEIHIRGAKVTTFQASAFAEDGCEAMQDQNGELIAAQELASQTLQTASADAAAASGLGDEAGNRLSRVACLYDAATLSYANLCAPDGNGASLINSTFRARLEAGNVVLANSQINVRWVYLGCALAPTPSSTDVQLIYTELTNSGSTLGAFARQKATEWGATEVFLASQSIAGTYAGYASLPGNFAAGFWNRNYFLMVHELGHNFGLRHDRYTDSAVAIPNDGNYAYAINLISTPVGNRQIVGTIMSYAHYFVPYFSNANLTLSSAITTHFYTADYSGSHQVVPAVYTNGTAGNFYYGAPNGTIDNTLITTTGAAADVQPLGIPAGQPYAADGSRTFRETAASTLASGWYIEPTITTQPQSVTVQPGQSFSLSVSARGTGTFAYQWYMGAAALQGATDTRYSVASAAAGDAATYHMVITVTDVTGTITTLTSNNATVAVNSATPTPVPTNNGGGGGGSIAPGMLAALLALMLTRIFRPLRTYRS